MSSPPPSGLANTPMVDPRTQLATQPWYRYLIDLGNPFTPVVAAPALLNGWTTTAVGEVVPGYYKDASGIVHVQGHVANGTLAVPAFILPAGFRPPSLMYFSTIAGAAHASAYATVDKFGNVELFVSNVSSHSLNTISFLATQ